MKKRYKLGQVFAVPIDSYFAIGIIVRENKEVLLGYFLNKKYTKLPSLEDIEAEKKIEFAFIKLFGSLGLDKGIWPILGVLKSFDTEKWLMPKFKRRDVINETYSKVFYDDNIKEVKVIPFESNENIDDYPDDGVAGYGFIEKRLSRLLTHSST